MLSVWIAQVHKGRVRDGHLAAVGHVERFDTAQVTEGSVRDLGAEGHDECFDPAQVHEGHVCDGRLIARIHVELLDPAQVHKCRVCDLSGGAHCERLNPTQMHKGSVRDPATSQHLHSVQSCAHIASNMDEVRIDDRFAPSPRYIGRPRCWESHAPRLDTSFYP